MRRFCVSLGAIGAVVITLASCSPKPSPEAAPSPASSMTNRPKVVATTAILCDLTRAIAQATIDLTCLLSPGQDVHSYQPLPADRRAIEDAQLILYSGYGLERKLERLIQANTRPIPKVAVAEQAVPKPLMGADAHAHDHDHDSADDHEAESEPHSQPKEQNDSGGLAPDPHVWQNAQYGAEMVQVITTALGDLVPTHEDDYDARANQIAQQLGQIHAWIQTQVATIPTPQRKLITTHNAFGYYAQAYGIPLDTALQGVSTEEKPSAARIQALVDTLKASQVPTIFVEFGSQPGVLQSVARDAKVAISTRPLFSDTLGEPGSNADTYLKLLQFNTQVIVEGLNGQFQPFKSSTDLSR